MTQRADTKTHRLQPPRVTPSH